MLRALCLSRIWLAVPAVLLLGACAADRLTDTGDPNPVAEELLPPPPQSLVVGQTQRLVARVARGKDTVVVTDVTWTSENTSIATVTDGNLLTALASGETYVTASRQGKKGRGHLRVGSVPVSRIVLDPATVSVIPGAQARILATTLDASNQTISGKVVAWSTSDPSVATVDGSGLVTAKNIGTASVVATSDGVVTNATVVVQPAAVASVQVTLNAPSIAVLQETSASAVLRDASGNVLTGRSIGWSSTNTAVATVDANGRVRGVSVGTASIVANSEGRTGSAAVTVTPQQVTSITLAPAVVNVAVGQAVTVAATLRDAAGNLVSGRTPSWTSAAPAIATVDGAGVVRGVAAGTAQVTASIDGAQAAASVTVASSGEPVVSVTPTSVTVVAGQAVQLSAVLRDASGNPVAATFAWSTSSPAVATVDASGRVQGIAPGTANVVATSNGRSASATITVTPVPVASVTIAPSSLQLVVGQSGTLAATCRDAAGNALAGRSVSWGSNATGVATVDALGVVRGVAAGSTTVVATCEGRTATAAVTVSAAPVASVTLTPASATVPVGATATLVATLRDATGATLTGRTVTWASSNPAVATVSSSGVVAGVAAGSASITATSEGIVGSAAITVNAPATMTGVELTPATVTLSTGAAQQFWANARWSDGTTRTTTVSWSATGGTISTAGLYVAGGTPGTYRVVAAAAGGMADTSVVTVQASTTIASCANEPAGLTPAFSTAWNTAPTNGGLSQEGWWHNELGSSKVANLSITQDADAPRSASNVLQMKFPQGSPGGDAPFWFGHALPANTGTVYMCVNFRADPTWTHGGNAGTKFAFIRTPYQDGTAKHNHFWGLAGGDWNPDELRPMFGTQWANPDLARAYFADNGQSVHGGQWRQIELLWIAEQPAGAQNGLGRLWIDGKLVVNVTNAQFFLAGQETRWTSFDMVPTYGGGIQPVPRDIYWWMDHTHVSVK